MARRGRSKQFVASLVGGPFDGLTRLIRQPRDEVTVVLCEDKAGNAILYRERRHYDYTFDYERTETGEVPHG